MQKTVPGFDIAVGLPVMAMHTFSTAADGQMEHHIDGKLRATVPPEGWADYCRQWPEAQDVVNALTKPTAPAVEVAQAEEKPAVDTVALLTQQLAAIQAEVNALKAPAVDQGE